ncbi:MAG: hypothetical protein [Caudoviricetes sp.]|nr:MAG: hypothetical protein [Caudoviricetes sp.]
MGKTKIPMEGYNFKDRISSLKSYFFDICRVKVRDTNMFYISNKFEEIVLAVLIGTVSNKYLNIDEIYHIVSTEEFDEHFYKLISMFKKNRVQTLFERAEKLLKDPNNLTAQIIENILGNPPLSKNEKEELQQKIVSMINQKD